MGLDFSSGGISSFLPLILILVVLYFLMIRPQQKRQKEMNEMRKNLKKGDKVQTAGGLVGKVVKVKDEVVTVESGRDKVRLDFLKNSLTVMEVSTSKSAVKEVVPEETEEVYEEYSEDVQDNEYQEYDVNEEGEYYEEEAYDGEGEYTEEYAEETYEDPTENKKQ